VLPQAVRQELTKNELGFFARNKITSTSSTVTIIPTSIPDVVLIEPRVYEDARGYFFESYHQQRFEEKTGIRAAWVQDNESRSSYGVLRGLHFQRPPMDQAKLVRVVLGKVLDVAVDIRPGSATFGEHVAVELSADNKLQMYIPRGFAHGFLVLSEEAVFCYKCDKYYAAALDGGIYSLDASLGIDWRLPPDRIQLSEKDKQLPTLAEWLSVFGSADI
jgi:dTDP-4-dehydrorhamnose 3,5-epimerase